MEGVPEPQRRLLPLFVKHTGVLLKSKRKILYRNLGFTLITAHTKLRIIKPRRRQNSETQNSEAQNRDLLEETKLNLINCAKKI